MDSPIIDPSKKTSDQEIEKIKFTGKTGEYFAIWLINHMFTWMTLGIYSAWAKVRTLQYFYGNTELAGGRFQFTADPLKILRGRIIAVLLFILYFVVENVQSTLANAVLVSMLVAFVVFSPVLTVLVMSFKLRYSEWRGISFNFNKNYKEAYRVYLIPNFFSALFLASLALPLYSTEVEEYFGYDSPVYQSDEVLEDEEYDEDYESEADEFDAVDEQSETLDSQQEAVTESETEYIDEEGEYDEEYSDSEYDDEYEEEVDTYMNPYLGIPAAVFGLLVLVLFPYFDFINVRFMSRNARIGLARFNYHASVGDYYLLYAKWFAAALLLAALWWLEIDHDLFDNVDLSWVLYLLTVMFIPATRSYFKSARYNLLLNKTLVDGKHQLQANTTFLTLFWIMMSNSVVMILTLGMMNPWAQIRTARYVLEHTSVEVNGSLDEFVAAQEKESNALAEEVADMFDIDIIG